MILHIALLDSLRCFLRDPSFAFSEMSAHTHDGEAIITLLELHPSKDFDAPIRCDSWTAALTSEPNYEALSYVWGDMKISVGIELNGREVPISQNLCSVMRRLRKPDTALTLWIDQLCINQEDAKEKSEQVALMREIYTGCRLCHVWIGELPQDVSVHDASWIWDAFEYMADYRAAGGSECRPLPNVLASTTDFEGPNRAMTVFTGADRSRPEVSWWTRIWTIQEAILPPRLRVMWGPLSMPWERMSAALLSLTTGPVDAGLHRFIYSPSNGLPLAILIANFAWVHNTKLTPGRALSLVFTWRHRNATDPRDKAYAIMGLCHKGDLPRTEKCDYQLSVTRVYTNLTVDLILLEKGLKPLAVDLKSGETKSIPGWTFNVSHGCDYETDWHYLYSYEHYSACGHRKLDCEAFEKRMVLEPDVLQIPGSLADVVAHIIGEPMVQNRHEELIDQNYRDCLGQWRDLGKKHYRNESAFWEDFGRTMVGDLVRTGEQTVERRATTEDVRNVYEFIKSGAGGGDFRSTIKRNIGNQTFFVTEKGMLGLGPSDTKAGDEIWVLDGGHMPIVLRPRKARSTEKGELVEDGRQDVESEMEQDEGKLEKIDFSYGGKSYVHGLMSGQLITGGEREPRRVMLRMH